jgi:hypothetical protein
MTLNLAEALHKHPEEFKNLHKTDTEPGH